MDIRDRVIELRWMTADELRSNPRNWRKHPPAQHKALRKVLEQIGFADRLLAYEDPDYGVTLIDGHLRKEKDMVGSIPLPVLMTDLNQQEANALLTLLDPLAAMAETDEALLKGLMAELPALDLGDVGADIAALLGLRVETDTAADPGAQVDKAAELQTKWGTARGDVWLIESASTPGQMHRLMCGDSTSAEDVTRLMGGAKADACITDPPYGIDRDVWDKPVDISSFTQIVKTIIKTDAFYAFFGIMPTLLDWMNEAQNTGFKYNEHIIWLKRSGIPVYPYLNRTQESILVYSQGKIRYFETEGYYADVRLPGLLDGSITLEALDRYIKDMQLTINRGYATPHMSNSQHKAYERMKDHKSYRSPEKTNFTNVWSFLPENRKNKNNDTDRFEHATVKPITCVTRLIELLSPPKVIVFEPFSGSGTTMIAAEQTGRVCYGMEIAPEYVAVALQRCADMGLTIRKDEG